jgi:hypothetical protein
VSDRARGGLAGSRLAAAAFALLGAALAAKPTVARAQQTDVDSLIAAISDKVGAIGGRVGDAGGTVGDVLSDPRVKAATDHDRDAKKAVGEAVRHFMTRAAQDSGQQLANDKRTFIATVAAATHVDLAHGIESSRGGRDINVAVTVPDVPQASVTPPATPDAPSAPAHVHELKASLESVPDSVPASGTSAVSADSAGRLLERARQDPGATTLPDRAAFTSGARSVPASAHVTGSVGTIDGTLTVDGTVDGDAVAVAGDVVLDPGSHVHGNVEAIGGQVRQQPGSIVDGEIRSTTGRIGPVRGAALARQAPSVWHQLKLALSCLALMIVVGIGVLTFASEPLDTAAQAVSERFGRSLGFGVVGLLAAIPVLGVALIALCLTIIGILFTPVLAVVYTLVVLGIALVGFFAVAETTGRAIFRSRQALDPLSERGAKLRALVTGITLYAGLWVVAALTEQIPVVGLVVRVIASAVTIMVVIVGCGAVLVAQQDKGGTVMVGAMRIGRRRPTTAPTPEAAPQDVLWQTPTPVGGVAAARRVPPPPPTQSIP